MTKTVHLGNLELHLAQEYDTPSPWIGSSLAKIQLKAAWMIIESDDTPMNPRIIGKPGVGKTTLAIAVAQELNLPVYILQATADTRPEDLIITPILSHGKNISYIASPLVSAMIQGGVCILDEGNRMSEKSWASLAALLDHRRYVDSVLAGVRIKAHENFRFVTTMNEDSSVFDIPEYIQSRLSPQIFIDFADAENEKSIIKYAVPYTNEELLLPLIKFLQVAHTSEKDWSVRDGIQISKYATRLLAQIPELKSDEALLIAIEQVLGPDAGLFAKSIGPQSSRLRPL